MSVLIRTGGQSSSQLNLEPAGPTSQSVLAPGPTTDANQPAADRAASQEKMKAVGQQAAASLEVSPAISPGQKGIAELLLRPVELVASGIELKKLPIPHRTQIAQAIEIDAVQVVKNFAGQEHRLGRLAADLLPAKAQYRLLVDASDAVTRGDISACSFETLTSLMHLASDQSNITAKVQGGSMARAWAKALSTLMTLGDDPAAPYLSQKVAENKLTNALQHSSVRDLLFGKDTAREIKLLSAWAAVKTTDVDGYTLRDGWRAVAQKIIAVVPAAGPNANPPVVQALTGAGAFTMTQAGLSSMKINPADLNTALDAAEAKYQTELEQARIHKINDKSDDRQEKRERAARKATGHSLSRPIGLSAIMSGIGNFVSGGFGGARDKITDSSSVAPTNAQVPPARPDTKPQQTTSVPVPQTKEPTVTAFSPVQATTPTRQALDSALPGQLQTVATSGPDVLGAPQGPGSLPSIGGPPGTSPLSGSPIHQTNGTLSNSSAAHLHANEFVGLTPPTTLTDDAREAATINALSSSGSTPSSNFKLNLDLLPKLDHGYDDAPIAYAETGADSLDKSSFKLPDPALFGPAFSSIGNLFGNSKETEQDDSEFQLSQRRLMEEGDRGRRSLFSRTFGAEYIFDDAPIGSVFGKIVGKTQKFDQPAVGQEKAILPHQGEIESYTGELPSPLQLMWYVPENDEVLKLHYPDSEIRSWVKDASEYHGIPHEMLAVILQQENGPNATGTQKVLQFGERSVTTFTAILDESFFDLVPDSISRGSSGFANMSYNTLQDAVEYTERVYDRNPLSDDVRYRVLGYDQDTRIPGDDYKADLYYASAHVRQLIDRVTGVENFDGVLTEEQTRDVFRAYNGSGPLAEQYADDANGLLQGALAGDETLYFYER